MKYQGLNAKQVEESRAKHGLNILIPPKKASLFYQFICKFKDPLIRILLIALVLAVGVAVYQFYTSDEGYGVLLEPLGILMAVILATGVGFIFEVSANKKFDILNQVNDDETVKVVRDGNVTMVPKREIVVGDIVMVETGDEVPADGVLLDGFGLQVNEADLTGEPMARKTTEESEFDHEATYPSNCLMRGSKIIDGHGVMQVVKVGEATEWGKVYKGSQIESNIKTPLNIQLDKLGRVISVASYMVAAAIIIIRFVMYFTCLETGADGIDWLDFVRYALGTLMMAVTIIVVAVPEGLPMSVTLSLALSMRRMLTANNLVRKMHACETMGAATVICTDKTGTLTQNRMALSDVLIYSEFDKLLEECISVNTTAFLDVTDSSKIKVIGNPTEGALLLWLHGMGANYLEYRENMHIYQQVPFSTKYKFMATVVESKVFNKPMFYVKGAPEIVLRHCNRVLTKDGLAPIDSYLGDIEKQIDGYNNRAMRTLAIAYKEGDPEEQSFDPMTDDLVANNLIFLAVAAIADPVRPDVAEAIESCMNAGIDVKIVTGDTSATAIEIGRQLGMWKDTDQRDFNHITGKDFEELSDEEAKRRIPMIKIMSRARPMDKERLVRLQQAVGEVVAVTGDGTNDAPALKSAQVGLSMGDGTNVAKEASDITILDNSFRSIALAVMWGRSLYLNIQRFILFQLTINVAACLIVMVGSLLGTDLVLTVTQMLWVNLIMDTFAAMALASLPPSESVMKEKPRSKNAHILTKPMINNIFIVGVSFFVLLFGFVQYFKHCDVASISDLSLRDYLLSFFNFNIVADESYTLYEHTLTFTLFVFIQFWNLFNAKAYHTGASAFKHISKNFGGFDLALLIILAGQVLIVNCLSDMFNVEPLGWRDWLVCFVGTSPVLLIGEFIRLFIKDKC
ncbi:MAG: calcium-translocating P-type ATPase, PMCA-type [Bacteroidales bacterium]|nr:calcium-translocating P-type ATPase, PMCA-type [Bacteroidales bacterium]